MNQLRRLYPYLLIMLGLLILALDLRHTAGNGS
jgi:hypothetical protein